jgi:thiopeptide-type bacteriocin biosynthesis protein
VNLDDELDVAALCALPAAERTRAFEIWPPLGSTIDDGGRRVELVAAVVVGGEETRSAVLSMMGTIPTRSAASGWRTIKIFAPREDHADLLVDEVARVVAQPAVRAWFFLPYVDEPAREHLRVRIQAESDDAAARLAAKLARRLASDARVATVDVGAYHPEHARWGNALASVERIFSSDSALVIDLYHADLGVPEEVLLAVGFDALADGLRIDAAARGQRCHDALVAYGVGPDEERDALASGYRAFQRDLLALLADLPAPFREHQRRVRALKLDRRAAAAFLPTLAHLAAVRLCGADRDAEVRALYLWKRSLESRRVRRGRRSTKTAPPRRAPPRS